MFVLVINNLSVVGKDKANQMVNENIIYIEIAKKNIPYFIHEASELRKKIKHVCSHVNSVKWKNCIFHVNVEYVLKINIILYYALPSANRLRKKRKNKHFDFIFGQGRPESAWAWA